MSSGCPALAGRFFTTEPLGKPGVGDVYAEQIFEDKEQSKYASVGDWLNKSLYS